MTEQTSMQVFSHWLENYLNFEKNPKKDFFRLDTMKFLCEQFDNPQNAYNSVHVAGSKGKGSVSVFCASILEEAGFKTGLYTSPHVDDIRERIRAPCSFFAEQEYKKAVDAFIPAADFCIAQKMNGKKRPTWFELMTLFAFFCFRNRKTDWAVFETGIGGRLDATNILVPQVCAITQIELEHTEYLGATLEAIAGEKAGIIKSNIPVCIARQENEAKEVFKSRARKTGAPVLFMEEAVQLTYMRGEKKSVLPTLQPSVKIVFRRDAFRQFEQRHGCPLFFSRPIKAQLKLQGEFQAENAALAAATVKIAHPDIDEQTIERGLEKAFLPARFEILQTSVQNKTLTIVIDGCHTANSMLGTLKTFYSCFGSGAHLLFACAANKDVDSMSRIVRDSPCAFSRIGLTIPGEAKYSDYEKTLNSFLLCFDADLLKADKDYLGAIEQAFKRAAEENKVLLCAGSFYLAGEVKRAIKKRCEESCKCTAFPPQSTKEHCSVLM